MNNHIIKRELVLAAKKRPCPDCGLEFPSAVMEFDHLPQFVKCFEISRWSLYTLQALQEELKKCEVVCANCHRIRTENRRVPAPPKEIKKPQPLGRPPHKRKFAADWLEKQFQEIPAWRSTVLQQKAKAAGITADVLLYALDLIGATPFKFGRVWYWRLDPHASPDIFAAPEEKP